MTQVGSLVSSPAQLDINAILRVMPHRYPFLLIDRLLEMEVGKRAVGLKNITVNEPYFAGHFPDRPIVPGVVIIEALAQLGCFALLHLEPYKDKLILFTGIDGMRFRRQVTPGDQLILKAEVLRLRSNLARFHGVATVEGQLVAEGDFLCAVVS